MKNKSNEEKMKIMNFVDELENALRPLVEKAATLGSISSNASAPKEGIAEIQSIPQMPEEKKQLVSVLLNYIDFMLCRAQTVGVEKFESELIHKLSYIVAVLVR